MTVRIWRDFFPLTRCTRFKEAGLDSAAGKPLDE